MNCICCLSPKTKLKRLWKRDFQKCQNCGFTFQFREKDINNKSSIVSHYETRDPHPAVAQCKKSFFEFALLELSRETAEREPRILDVGCGYGYFLDIAQKKGWLAWGVEIARDAASCAHRRIGQDNIFWGKLKQAKFPDEFFNALTLWDVLFIVDNPFDELEECYRVMKQGGMIGIRLRNILFQTTAYRIFKPFQSIAYRFGLKKPYVFHTYNFSHKAIEKLLTRVGFNDIRIVNSPLTDGDPYKYSDAKGPTSTLKFMIDVLARIVLVASIKRIIIGPSLLIWARKPL